MIDEITFNTKCWECSAEIDYKELYSIPEVVALEEEIDALCERSLTFEEECIYSQKWCATCADSYLKASAAA